MNLRRRPFTYAPPPAEVLSPAELARAETWRQRWGETMVWTNPRPKCLQDVYPRRLPLIEFSDRHDYAWRKWVRMTEMRGQG